MNEKINKAPAEDDNDSVTEKITTAPAKVVNTEPPETDLSGAKVLNTNISEPSDQAALTDRKKGFFEGTERPTSVDSNPPDA